MAWLTYERRVFLFPAWILVRDTQRRESPTRRKQDINLCRTCTCSNIFMLLRVTLFIVRYQYLLINPCILTEFILEVPLLINDDKQYNEFQVRLKGQAFSDKLVGGKIFKEKKSSLEVLIMTLLAPL